MARTREPPADAQYRELTASVFGAICTICAAAVSATASRLTTGARAKRLGASVRRDGGDGIVYPSVRWPGGQAAALFWPDRVRLPVTQARTLQYHWDGTHMTRYFVIGEDDWRAWPAVNRLMEPGALGNTRRLKRSRRSTSINRSGP